MKNLFSSNVSKPGRLAPDHDWLIVLIVFIVALIMVSVIVAYDYLSFRTLSSKEEPVPARNVLNEKVINYAAGVVKEREGRFQNLIDNPPTVVDPAS